MFNQLILCGILCACGKVIREIIQNLKIARLFTSTKVNTHKSAVNDGVLKNLYVSV